MGSEAEKNRGLHRVFLGSQAFPKDVLDPPVFLSNNTTKELPMFPEELVYVSIDNNTYSYKAESASQLLAVLGELATFRRITKYYEKDVENGSLEVLVSMSNNVPRGY